MGSGNETIRYHVQAFINVLSMTVEFALLETVSNLCNGFSILDHLDEAGLWSSGHAAIGNETQV